LPIDVKIATAGSGDRRDLSIDGGGGAAKAAGGREAEPSAEVFRAKRCLATP
jgi:hypothetical protein